jgi:multiple sugar transport system substrate-binding protein
MTHITRRSLITRSTAFAATGVLSRPYLANAAAVTASAWFAQGFIPSEDVALRQLVADYEKASGNAIELSIVPFVALRQKEVAAITSGVAPDVMEDADFSFTPLNAWQDNLLDVSDLIETQKSRLSPVVLAGRHLYNNVKKERSYYGVPLKMASTTFHIWSSLVEKAGYKMSDIPKTWDAFYDFFLPLQAKLRDKGLRHVYALCVEVSTNGVDPLATFNANLVANGGLNLVTPDGKLQADDPQVREAVIKTLTRFAQLFKDGYVPHEVVNWNDQDNNNSFHSKAIILCFNGSLSIELAQIDQKEEYNDQVTHGIPLANDGKPLPAQIGEFGLVIPKAAKNVAVGKEFIKYSMEPEVLNKYLKGGLGRWAIPYPDMVKSDPFWLHSGDPHRTAYITQTLVGPTFPLYEAYSPAAAQMDAEHVFQVAWHDIVAGGMTAKEASDKAFKRAKEIFARYPIPQT